jgi:hypothetical protein
MGAFTGKLFAGLILLALQIFTGFSSCINAELIKFLAILFAFII